MLPDFFPSYCAKYGERIKEKKIAFLLSFHGNGAFCVFNQERMLAQPVFSPTLSFSLLSLPPFLSLPHPTLALTPRSVRTHTHTNICIINAHTHTDIYRKHILQKFILSNPVKARIHFNTSFCFSYFALPNSVSVIRKQ